LIVASSFPIIPPQDLEFRGKYLFFLKMSREIFQETLSVSLFRAFRNFNIDIFSLNDYSIMEIILKRIDPWHRRNQENGRR